MDPIVEEFTITLKYQVSVNTETGEMTTKCISRKIDKSNFEVTEVKKKSQKKVESNEPLLMLDTNKFTLTQAAVFLMEIKPGDKLDIKYEKNGTNLEPVIGTAENFGTPNAGNKFTKSYTCVCRGNKNQELSKYGTEFLIVPYKDGIFKLVSKDKKVEENIVDILDDDLQDLIDDKDAKVEEIDTNIFQL